MSSSGTTRLLAVGSVMSAATAVRMGRGYVKVWSKETPKLLDLWLEALDPESESKAPGKFRDELIKATRKSKDVVCAEVERGISDVEKFTAPKAKKDGAKAG